MPATLSCTQLYCNIGQYWRSISNHLPCSLPYPFNVGHKPVSDCQGLTRSRAAAAPPGEETPAAPPRTGGGQAHTQQHLWEPSNVSSFDHRKYRPARPVALRNRHWPDQSIDSAPIWASVDLRDGNQALLEPMNVDPEAPLVGSAGKDRAEGDRGRFPVREPAGLRLRALADRERPHPRGRHRPGPGAGPRVRWSSAPSRR